MDSVTRFFAYGFFLESSSPKPLIIVLGLFQFFQKITEIFASQWAPWVSTTPTANLPPIPQVLLILAGNLPPVSMTPVAICHCNQLHWRQICHGCQ